MSFLNFLEGGYYPAYIALTTPFRRIVDIALSISCIKNSSNMQDNQ